MQMHLPLQINNQCNRLINNQKIVDILRIMLIKEINFGRYSIEYGEKQNGQGINNQKLTFVCWKSSLRVVTLIMRVSS